MKILFSANEVKLALDAVGKSSSRIKLGKTCTLTVEKRLQNVPILAIFNKNITE